MQKLEKTIDWLNYIYDLLDEAPESPDGQKERILKSIYELICIGQLSDEHNANDSMLSDAYEYFSGFKSYLDNYIKPMADMFAAFDNISPEDKSLYGNYALSRSSLIIDNNNYQESALDTLGDIDKLHYMKAVREYDADFDYNKKFYEVYAGGSYDEFKADLPDEPATFAEKLYNAAKCDIKCRTYAKEAALGILTVAAGNNNENSFISTENKYLVDIKFAYHFIDERLDPLWTSPAASVLLKNRKLACTKSPEDFHILYQDFADEILLIDIDRLLSKDLCYYEENYALIEHAKNLTKNIKCLHDSENDGLFDIDELALYDSLSEQLSPVFDFYDAAGRILQHPMVAKVDITGLTRDEIVDNLLEDDENVEFWTALEKVKSAQENPDNKQISDIKDTFKRLISFRFANTLFAKPDISGEEMILINAGLRRPGHISREYYKHIFKEISNSLDNLAVADEYGESYFKALSLLGKIALKDDDFYKIDVSEDSYTELARICNALETLNGDITKVIMKGKSIKSNPELLAKSAMSQTREHFDRTEYYREFYRLSNGVKSTSLDSSDETEFIIYRSDMDKLLGLIGNAEDYEFFDILYEGLYLLDTDRKRYCDSCINDPQLSAVQLKRIKYMNRLSNMISLMDGNIAKPISGDEGINCRIAEKVYHEALATGVNGRNSVKYRQHYFHPEELFEAALDMAEAKPFVKAYNRPISMSDRAKLLKMNGTVVLKTVCKALKCTPVEILKYSTVYDDITQ